MVYFKKQLLLEVDRKKYERDRRLIYEERINPRRYFPILRLCHDDDNCGKHRPKMPRNKKGTAQEQVHESEGRPPNLTLGCFIKEAKKSGRKAAIDGSGDKEKLREQYQSSDLGLQAQGSDFKEEKTSAASDKDFNEKQVVAKHQDQDENCAVTINDNFKIMRTKKGGFPIYLEKRAKGKKVTVLRQVSGNSKQLLQLLKTKFGTGGLIKEGEVEIQGDFEAQLLKFLKENSQYMVQYKP